MLSIDRNCNLKCEMCRSSSIYDKQLNMTAWRILERLLDAYRDVEQPTMLQCDGAGDVFVSGAYRKFFMHKDLPKCFNLEITTNGNLLTKNQDIIETLGDRIKVIEVSFDAATVDTYKAVRGGSFDTVLEGMKMLKEMGVPTRTQFVVQKRNYQEILAYLQLATELGSSHIGLQGVFRAAHMSERWWAENCLDSNSNVDLERLKSDLEIFKKRDNTNISGNLESLLH